ncbi:MAG TPA: TonB-dependent receptor [Allosphingosinicella sp.]|jgi:outer membrane receptor protein involved in Fe transport
MKRTRLLSACATFAMIAPAPLMAQAAPAAAEAETEAQTETGSEAVAEAEAGIQDIVVTAQRREQALQDVPIAVTAFTGESLEERRIDDALDVQFNTPNLIYVGNERPALRGVGNNAISSTAENGTPAFTNGAYVGARAENEYYDLERIEILRGPQGTLFGRNTTGGAINLITRRPNGDFGGEVFAEYGNFDSLRLKAALNLPLGDVLQQRFAGYYLKRDGYTENLFTGRGIDSRDQFGLRSSTRLVIGPSTQANLMVQYYRENSSRSRENKRLCKATPVLGCSPVELGFDSPDAATTVFQKLLAAFSPAGVFPKGGNIYAGAVNPPNLRQVSADYDPTYFGEELLATLDLSHDFGSITLNSLSGYAKGETEANTDYDNAALPFRFLKPITYRLDDDTVITTDQLRTTDSFKGRGRTYTQELRLTSDFEGPIDFTAGLFYLNTRSSASFEIFHPALELAAIAFGLPEASRRFINETPRAKTESRAVFGETYVRLGEATQLTFGLRYTKDEKAIRTRTILLSPPGPFVVAEREYSRVTGRAAIDHEIDHGDFGQSRLYASFARGYKAGGLNPGNSNTPEFAPESLDAFEIGAKNDLFGRKVQANLAAFYYDYNDLQLGQRVAGTAITSNGDARVWGLEGEFLFLPMPRLQFNANLSYLKTRIGDFTTVDAANPAQVDPKTQTPKTSPQVPVNLRGNELPYAPNFKANFGAQYTIPLGAGGWSATVRGDYVFQGNYFAREFNTPNDRIDSWRMANAYLRFVNGDETIGVELFVKNIGDSDAITSSIIEDAQVGSYRNVRVLEPRTFGVSTRLRF